MDHALPTRAEICQGGTNLRTMLGMPTGLTVSLWWAVSMLVYLIGGWVVTPLCLLTGLILHGFGAYRTKHDPHWFGILCHALRYKKEYR